MNDSVVTFAPEDRGFVYAVARRIVGSADDAEDVTQDALLLAYRHRASFRGDSRYRTWLYRIAMTTALGHLRRQRRVASKVIAGEGVRHLLEIESDPADSPPVALEKAETRAAVQRALDKLSPLYRDVLIARADANEHEVADRLGISVANVKIRSHRGRKHLRATLERMEAHAA